MEGGKKKKPDSSLDSDLFGSKSPSSSGVLSTIFSPQTGQQQSLQKKNGSGNEKSGVSGPGFEGGNRRISTKELFGEGKEKPHQYGSSIYYGAQDVYFQTEATQKTGHKPVKKDGDGGEEQDGASRGNWWQGSLYY